MSIENFNTRFTTYPSISEMIKTHSSAELLSHISNIAGVSIQTLADYPMGSHVKGTKNDAYRYVLEDIKDNIHRYNQVYALLEDEASRRIFTLLLQCRLLPNTRYVQEAFEITNQIPEEEFTMSVTEIAEEDIISALLAAKEEIKKNTPCLAICISQVISNLWEVPLLLHMIHPDYTYRIRHTVPDELSGSFLYAIPAKKNAGGRKRAQTAVAIPWRNGWMNTELTKDCGLIPFLLQKNHNLNVTMVGAKTEEYPYLDTYVPGLHMQFLATGSVSEKVQYIKDHAKEIDLLILRGCYSVNYLPARTYKALNPEGKIYVGLDANSRWMDRIQRNDPDFTEFMDSCDVIATSCRALQQHLNEKWPWKIEYIPNGYYSYGAERPAPDYEKKENTILTVSRLGTEQKATDVLLNAFAMIAEQIPDWNLKLVGNMEETFQCFLDNYFIKYPHLKSRVIFTGSISDKDVLFEEYYNAKVFVLTSVIEGGTPNVVAEALWSGCAMATTKFDAWEDVIDYGACGMAANINNIPEIAAMLQTLCTKDSLLELSENAYQYARRNYDMEAIVSKLYKMIWGGEEA